MLWRRIVVSVVMFGVLAACGADTPAASGDGEPGSSKSSESKGGGWLSWVPFGPGDPGDPTPTWPAYNYFADGKCSSLRDYLKKEDLSTKEGGDFGRAMLALCLATVKGQSKQWAVVEANADAETGALDHPCLTPLVKGLMDRAVAWHKAHPGQKPKVKFQRVKGETKCGRIDNKSRPKETLEPTDEPSTEPTDEPSATEEPTDEQSPTSEPSEESSPGETTEPTG
jgi:hypothetical protein